MPSSISIRHLRKTFPGGVIAIDDLSLDVPRGSVFGFLGPNGAGKTTALKIVAGLVRPSAGSVEVVGIPLSAGVDYRRHIGYLGQEPQFYPWMTARETLRYVAGFHPGLEQPIQPLLDELLGITGLSEAADRRTGEYSSGMRQRLGIAQALVGRPSVILLDEPVSALDPIGRREVLDLLKRLRGTTTVFYSTHILDDIERVADHVAILDRGRLVAAAPTADLLGGSTRGSLRVVIAAGGAAPGLVVRFRALDGVLEVLEDPQAHGARAFTVRTTEPALGRVQVAVTRIAADEGLALVENRPVRLDLETVFLSLIQDQERIA